MLQEVRWTYEYGVYRDVGDQLSDRVAREGLACLLTWNCRHLDNAEMKPVMRSVCAVHGYACPEICVPLELMGDEYER